MSGFRPLRTLFRCTIACAISTSALALSSIAAFRAPLELEPVQHLPGLLIERLHPGRGRQELLADFIPQPFLDGMPLHQLVDPLECLDRVFQLGPENVGRVLHGEPALATHEPVDLVFQGFEPGLRHHVSRTEAIQQGPSFRRRTLSCRELSRAADLPIESCVG